jgi:hypothetical protein
MSTKVDERQLTVKLSYNNTTDRFYIDFWEAETEQPRYIVSVNINENVAKGISNDTGIQILIQ